jgi:ATP-binding cassette subfamily B protein
VLGLGEELFDRIEVGEYLGRKMSLAPAERIAWRMPFPLWLPRLSRMTMLAHSVDNVHFSYSRGGSQVLNGISLKIEPGEMVALVGPSGGGKSTLVRLALRLCDPTAGAVLIDGIDLRSVTLESLRKAVAAVFQEPFVFHGSIGENIRYGRPEANHDQMRAVAGAAHVEDFVRLEPNGYGTPAGPRGERL